MPTTCTFVGVVSRVARLAASVGSTAFACLLASSLEAQTYQVLHEFGPSSSQPFSALIADASGNLYGTTAFGGSNDSGTVYKLDASNDFALTTLHSFADTDGREPQAAVLADASGNLYGTTSNYGPNGSGTVFKLDAANGYALTTLHSFAGLDGLSPRGALIADASGNLYGTTAGGGSDGSGTIFKLDAANNYVLTTVHSFAGPDGGGPVAAVVADASGNLYGTTSFGGTHGSGTVFKLDAANDYALSTLHSFAGPDGQSPQAAVIFDASGNLYGTTTFGGSNNYGTVFKLDAADGYALTTLHSFAGPDGQGPQAAVIADASCNLYGTTAFGGGPNGYGTVYKLDAANDYALRTLHSFSGPDGARPYAALLADSSGNLYGTTQIGGPQEYSGTVFKLDAANEYELATLRGFSGPGTNPFAALIADASGNLYGTTYAGGPYLSGTVFKLDAANDYALTTLHSFDGLDGSQPQAAVIADASGNLYGTTWSGGPTGSGTVFKLDAANDYALTILHAFDFSDGGGPVAALIADASGNLYGTASYGGYFGWGTVFKLDAANSYALTTLHAFDPDAFQGFNPSAPLIADASGNLYGTTAFGGGVFKLDAANDYHMTVLHSFEGPDGLWSVAAVLADASGNLSGTTSRGGPYDLGTVFKLDAANNYALTTLHSFAGPDGQWPEAALIADASGNLYGTTSRGGPANFGTVFKLDAANDYALTTLHSFAGSDGAVPRAAVLADASGTLFGTTSGGGAFGTGVVFSLTTGAPAAVTGITPTSGPSAGGTAVTITGTGFSPNLTVTIGGALATGVTVVSSTEITALTPPLPPGTLNDVAVTNATSGPSVPGVLPGAFFSDFLDAPQEDGFHSYIATIFRNGITAGCGGGDYCRDSPVTRAQMAVFLLKAKLGSDHVPAACTGTVFLDVPCTGGPFDPWIEELASLGITGGCGGGNYCPDAAVTRQQMAVFLLKAHDGASHTPPACVGIFGDVPCTPGVGFPDWIEEIYARSVTGGCQASPLLYCPTNPNTRGQMAVFLVKTFGL